MKRFFIFLFCLWAHLSLGQKQHPFLIVQEEDFPVLREKAAVEPFVSIKAQADQHWNDDFKIPNWNKMAQLLSHNTLLYALEENKSARKKYKQQIVKIINRWDEMVPHLGKGHSGAVYASNAMFNSLLAMDMIYNDLSSKERKRLEQKIDTVYEFFRVNRMPDGNHIWWVLSRLGVMSVYNIYYQAEEQSQFWSKKYQHHLMEISMSSDGSWVQSPGYAHARMTGTRTAKANTVDVIQANGYFDFYHHPKMKQFMLWLNTFALTPFGNIPSFGETGYNKANIDGGALFHFMGCYDERAAQMGRWHKRKFPLGEKALLNDFINYSLTPKNAPEPAMPSSLLMENTGAALWGKTGDTEALQGILYSLKRDNWEPGGFHHASEDVNSIGIQAYGEFMVMNSGTNYYPSYPGKTPDGNRWYEAWMQNVLLIGARRHEIRGEGGGLVDGLTGGEIEFGTTSSRGAFKQALHERSLIFVHQKEKRNYGYFVVVDQADLSFVKDTVSVMIQPNTKFQTTTTLEPHRKYSSPINGLLTDQADGSEAVITYFASEPLAVKQGKSWKGAFHLGDLASDHLEAQFLSDSLGQVRSMSLIIPTDQKHKAPEIQPIKGQNMHGVILRHYSGQEDINIISNEISPAHYDGKLFKGRSLTCQYSADQSINLMAISCLQLEGWQNWSFEADVPVSIYGNDEHLQINAPNGFKGKLTVKNGTPKATEGCAIEKIANNTYRLSAPKGNINILIQP